MFETLRIALLAAAFDLCISVGTQRRTEAAAAAQATTAETDTETETVEKPAPVSA